MYEKEILVTHDAGLHARPATMIVKIAMQYDDCEIFLVKGSEEGNAKSIMTVLGMGISGGSTLTIRAVGNKEQEVVERLYRLIETDFDKDKNVI